MSKEKSKLEQLQDHFDDRVEKKVEDAKRELKSDLERKFMETAPSVQTESRTSKWADYEPNKKGHAFREWVKGTVLSQVHTGSTRNVSKYVDKTFQKRFIDTMHNRTGPIAIGEDGGDQVLDKPLFQEVLALLRDRLVLDELGVTMVPMSSRTLDLPRETTHAAFAYTDESATIDESKYDFDQKQLVAKKLAGRVAVTNDFLRSNPVAGANWIANKMLADFAVAMERAIIDGAVGGPESLFDGIDAANKLELTVDGGRASDLDDYQAKVHQIIQQIAEDAKVPLEEVRVLMNVSHKNFLRRQRDNGMRVFPEIVDNMYEEYPVSVSTLIGNDYDDSGDGDGDETRIFVGSFRNYWIGMLDDMRLEYSEDSRFQTDEVEWRLVGHHDGKLTRGDRLGVLTTDIE